jgi:hypothetical protein
MSTSTSVKTLDITQLKLNALNLYKGTCDEPMSQIDRQKIIDNFEPCQYCSFLVTDFNLISSNGESFIAVPTFVDVLYTFQNTEIDSVRMNHTQLKLKSLFVSFPGLSMKEQVLAAIKKIRPNILNVSIISIKDVVLK